MSLLRVLAVTLMTVSLVVLVSPEGAEESIYTEPKHKEIKGDEGDGDQCKQNCTGIKADEMYYFDGYADIQIHEQMIGDKSRTDTYRNAIMDNADRISGKVVADIGAGTGILSMFCVQAGAKKVYAVEASDLANLTKKIVAANGMEDKITVIKSKVEIADIPEEIDVIVSEWMGYGLLFENMLPSVLFTRDKWLKKGGSIFPNTADLYMAPIKDDGFYKNKLDFWDEVHEDYGLDMSPLQEHARSSLTRGTYQATVKPADVLASAAHLQHLDIETMTTEDLKLIQSKFFFSVYSKSKVYGFALWFDVGFPREFTLSTSPFQKTTHWYQTILYVDEPFRVKKGSSLFGSVVLKPNTKNERFLDIVLEYETEATGLVKKTYLMDG